MSEREPDSTDPIRAWRAWFQENEQRWSDAMTEVLGDDRFARVMGRYFQEALEVHRRFTDAMGQYLANLNVPSRSDLLELGDRIGALEDAVATLEVDLRSLGKPPPSAMRPRRTRRPPESDGDA